MTLTPNEIKQFVNDDYDILKKALAKQLQEHFNILVEAVPTIKTIGWYASQEDESVFDVAEFKLFKNNGYIFEYNLSGNEPTGAKDEFKQEEVDLILEFHYYLKKLSNVTNNLWGSRYLKLDNKNQSELLVLSVDETLDWLSIEQEANHKIENNDSTQEIKKRNSFTLKRN